MIAWALAGLALGTVQIGVDGLAETTRCAPVFTLMGWETGRRRPLPRPTPQADAQPDPNQPRREERPRLRPCLHLANG